MAKSKTKAPPPRFRVGDWVVWRAGPSRNVVRIVEDVGLVGHDRQRYYRFRTYPLYGDPVESEMREDWLEEPATATEIATAAEIAAAVGE